MRPCALTVHACICMCMEEEKEKNNSGCIVSCCSCDQLEADMGTFGVFMCAPSTGIHVVPV